MRTKGSAAELERVRLRAVALVQEGNGPTEVARMVGAHRRTVQRWARRHEVGGKKALKAKPHPGPEPKLHEGQKQELARELLRGAKTHGFSTDLWTGRRVAQVIRRRFGVTYHPLYMSLFLREYLHWSCQKPKKRAYERDEKAIQHWVQKDWPRIKKSPVP